DSDYDVRFIYVRPVEQYLKIHPGRDVIECKPGGDLDLSGWDLRKALGLLKKSNPPLLEWFKSPTVYTQYPQVVEQIRRIIPDYYSPRSCFFHYLHMAKRNHKEYLKGRHVWLKKYFYVLRPVLACMWIERGYGDVPMEFEKLTDRLVAIGSNLDAEILKLVYRKRRGDELDRGDAIPEISEFLDFHIDRLSGYSTTHLSTSTRQSTAALDRVLRSAIIQIYGARIPEDVEEG
ncbi:unnamed protein product, partial [marine sediment metagenome]